MLNRFAKVGWVLVLCSTGVCGVGSPSASAQQFPQGPCSGVLCSTIGGQQAPQKSLFPEGQCGGIFCAAIGGAQAPPHAEPPPPCGGGLFCDLNPYGMAVPVTAAEAQRLQAEQARQAVSVPPDLPKPRKPHRVVKKRTAKAAPDIAAK